MSDDPCGFVFSHEAIMRRLMSILRQTQEECDDNNCLDDSGSVANPGNTLMMVTLVGMFALVMFMARPNSMRPPPPPEFTEKPDRDDQSGPPPPPLQ